MSPVRYTTLDAFRGIAAVLVLLFHSPFLNGSKLTFFSNSDIFVDLFFILSGFVISHSYLKKITSGYPIKSFLQNRFARIYPLHITLMIVWLLFFISKEFVLSYFNIQNQSVFNSNDSYAFFLHSLLLNAHWLDDHLSWNAPAWSIGAEFYTYITFFIFAVALKLNNHILRAMLIAGIAYSIIYMIKPITLLRTFDLGFVRALGGFFIGVTIYLLSQPLAFKSNLMPQWQKSLIEVALILLIYLGVCHFSDSKNGQLLIFTLFALTILFFSQSNGLISQLLNKRLFQQLGTLSYSIYLIHFLIITVIANAWELIFPSSVSYATHPNTKIFQSEWAFLINLSVILITYFCATVSYKLVERPFQKRLRAKSIIK